MTPGRRVPRAGRGHQRSARGEESVATLTIEGIAAGGDGVGRIGAMVVFVPRTAPGDVVQIAYRTHANHARGRLLQVLHASPVRVAPPCHHYVEDRCGGCQLQHMSAASQDSARCDIVQDALQRIGTCVIDKPHITSGSAWGYRGRLTLTLRPRGSGWIGGLHPHDDATRVFALERCPVAHPALIEAWHAIRAVAHGLPDAPELRIGLRLVGDDDVEVAAVVVGGSAWLEARIWAAEVARRHPSLSAIWWQRSNGAREMLHPANAEIARVWDEPVVATARVVEGRTATAVVDDLQPAMHEALAFAQINREVARALRACVAGQLRRFQPRRVIDAYAGAGELTEIAAQDGIAVLSIEADVAATTRATHRLDGYANVQIVTATVESALAAALPADVVVLNPPRRGLDSAVAAILRDAAAQGVRGLIYVSCDPATLARDVARLSGWHVDHVECFDMFPQTAHVETVCVLIPGGA